MNELIMYEVGASVRRELLGEEVSRRDWLIPGATAETLMAQGYERMDFLGHCFSNDSEDRFFTAAIEMPMAGKRPHVQPMAAATLDQDLARRDLSINAMARSPDGELHDPFNGQEDLQTGALRHINEHFSDDPMRLIRAARLAAQYAHFGFRLTHGTFSLMKAMADDDALGTLDESLIRGELLDALASQTPSRFFQTLARCNALETLFPEISTDSGVSDSAHGGTIPPWLYTLDAARKDGKAAQVSVLSQSLGESFVNRWLPN